MKVFIKDEPYSMQVDIYLVSDDVGGQRNITVERWDDETGPWFHEERIPEAASVGPLKPFLRLSRPMYEALKEAFTDFKMIKVDEEMVKAYRKEQERVDRMLTYLMEGH